MKGGLSIGHKRDEGLQHGLTLETLCYVKEASTKHHILHDPIFMKSPEQANL